VTLTFKTASCGLHLIDEDFSGAFSMKILKFVLLIVGGLCALSGLIWMGQGSGIFPYPSTSPMIDQSPWIYRGLALSVAGAVVIFISRRLKV